VASCFQIFPQLEHLSMKQCNLHVPELECLVATLLALAEIKTVHTYGDEGKEPRLADVDWGRVAGFAVDGPCLAEGWMPTLRYVRKKRGERFVAFAMGYHKSLGVSSLVNQLDPDLIKMVLRCTCVSV